MGDSVVDGALIDSDSQRLAEDAAVHSVLVQWEGYKNLKRVKAFHALNGERTYQERLYKKTGQDLISIPGELALLKVYLDKAFETYAETFGDPGEKPTMDTLRKVTAIGLRVLENYGCPLRDIEASLAARSPEQIAHKEEAKVKESGTLECEDVRW